MKKLLTITTAALAIASMTTAFAGTNTPDSGITGTIINKSSQPIYVAAATTSGHMQLFKNGVWGDWTNTKIVTVAPNTPYHFNMASGTKRFPVGAAVGTFAFAIPNDPVVEDINFNTHGRPALSKSMNNNPNLEVDFSHNAIIYK
jgi:hypothetical protein